MRAPPPVSTAKCRQQYGRGGLAAAGHFVERVSGAAGPTHRAADSEQLQIASRGLAPFLLNLVADRLALVEGADAGTFHRADMDEHVLAPVIRLNETEALLRIEPLHFSRRHDKPIL